MSTILAGHFQLQEHIEQARDALLDAGFAASAISAFYVNQAGQHDLHLADALVGADVGFLSRLHSMKEAGQAEHAASPQAQPRKAGMVIAVALAAEDQRERALAVLRQLGADHVEQAQGIIEEGDWRDFDPLSTPVLVE